MYLQYKNIIWIEHMCVDFFFIDGHRDDIIVVYDGEKYDGIVTYDSFLCSANLAEEDGYIFKEKYIYVSDNESIWSELAEIFRKFSSTKVIIPIFNQAEELLYFAYEDKENEYNNRMISNIIHDLESLMPENFLREVYPQIKKIIIYDLNELGYRFYVVLRKCGYGVAVVGEKWEVLFPKIAYNMINSEGIPESDVASIYAEGIDFVLPTKTMKGRDVSGYWRGLLTEIAGNYYKWLEQQMQKIIKTSFCCVSMFRCR